LVVHGGPQRGDRRYPAPLPYRPTRAGDGGPDEAIYLEVDADRVSDPAAVLEDREMVDLVWQAAKALNPRDYSLLDLHLRQGLTPDELAEHLGARRGSVYMMLSRLKEALEDAVTCLLLVRRGRRECPALDALMSTLQVGDLTKQARKAIRKHIDACDRCRERSRRFIAPAEIFSSFAVVPVTPELRAHIWDGIVRQLPAGTRGEAPPAREPSSRASSSIRRMSAAATNAVAALVAAGALLLVGSSALPAQDPADVHSTSHQLAQLSAEHTIVIAWSAQRDVRAYSVLWSQQPRQEPLAQPALPGSAQGAASPPLVDGSWYFHLRTEAPSGMWTDTVHLGPFVLGSGNDVLAATDQAVPPPTVEAASPPAVLAPVPTDTPRTGTTASPSPSDLPRPSATPAPVSASTTMAVPTAPVVVTAAPSATAVPESPTSAPLAPTGTPIAATATAARPTAVPSPTETAPSAVPATSPSPTAVPPTATSQPPTPTSTPSCSATFAAPGCVRPTATPTARILLRAP